MVDEGAKAPALSLPADDGTTVKTTDAKLWTVLFFYPRDDTSGCTTEALEFTGLARDFDKLGARVYGISKDSIDSHCRFRDKHGLKVPLLSDEDGKACDAFDVIKEKSMYGKTFLGIERSTFLIAPGGNVVKVWRKVKAGGHAETVLDALRDAQKAS